jgi:hypothetical protein
MDNRWAIYIDIEGFSTLHANGNNAALWALNRLMLAIYRIGTTAYPQSPDRLFAHQFGDGFLIVSDFHEKNLDRAALIAVLLMKYITNFGVFAKAAIAEGDLSDISGCYPDEAINNYHSREPIMMGEGLMTISPVMGTALINAVSINKRSPKGPLLITSSDYKDRLSSIFIVNEIPEDKLISLDWVHTECNELIDIHKKADLEYPSSENLEKSIRDYVIKHDKLPSEWITNCSKHLKVENIHNPF